MKRETVIRALVSAGIIGLLAIALGGGIRIARLGDLLLDRDRRIEALEGELAETQRALDRAKEAYLDAKESADGIRAERDSIVEQLGIVRDAVSRFEYSVSAGQDIIAESIGLVERLTEILSFHHGIRSYSY